MSNTWYQNKHMNLNHYHYNCSKRQKLFQVYWFDTQGLEHKSTFKAHLQIDFFKYVALVLTLSLQRYVVEYNSLENQVKTEKCKSA